MANIIALHGPKGCGKDTFVEMAMKLFPQINFNQVAFADPIKTAICEIFDLESQVHYDEFKRGDVEVCAWTPDSQLVEGRQVVRGIGMLMRSYDTQQFVEYVEQKIQQNSHIPNMVWCITDLRFDNEIQFIKKMGGLIVKINRPSLKFDGHASETEIPDQLCDFFLDNSSGLKEYSNNIYNLINTMKLNKDIIV